MQDKGNIKGKNPNKKYTIFLIIISTIIVGLSVLGYTRWQQDLKKAKTYLAEKKQQEQTNNSLTVELNALQQKIDSTSNFELLQQQSADLSAQIEVLNQQIIDLNTQKTTIEKDITKTTSDLAALDKKIKTATTDYNTKKAELDALNTKIAKFAELKTALVKYQTDSNKLSEYLNTAQNYLKTYNTNGTIPSESELTTLGLSIVGKIGEIVKEITKINTLIDALAL